MVATATNIKTPALPAQIDVNGATIATPNGATGIVGKLNGHDLYVVRNGQTLSLRSGDWLMDGDRVVTTSAAEQVLYFAGNMPNTLNRIVFGRGADFRIQSGEVYTTSLMTMSLVAAREALANETGTAIGTDDPSMTTDETQLAEDAMEVESSNGLFGTGILASGVGTTLGIGGAALAVLGLADSDKNDETSAPTPAPPTDDTGGDNEAPADEAPSGNFSGGAAQLTNALPLEQGGDMGANFEGMLVEWAGMLDSAAPAGQGSGMLPGLGNDLPGVEALNGALTAPLQTALSPITTALALESLPTPAVP